jgi:hypothetical protein
MAGSGPAAPVENLGFRDAGERYGLDRQQALDTGGPWLPVPEPKAAEGPLSGIWLSRYEYRSSSRDRVFTGLHYALVIQHGTRLQVRSIPESAGSRMMIDMTVNGQVLTGTWTERTDPDGYYHGAVYHGAIQMLAEPTGRKMAGKWVGFGHNFELNTGPWTLELVSADTGTEAIAAYSTPPPAPGAR